MYARVELTIIPPVQTYMHRLYRVYDDRVLAMFVNVRVFMFICIIHGKWVTVHTKMYI